MILTVAAKSNNIVNIIFTYAHPFQTLLFLLLCIISGMYEIIKPYLNMFALI